MLRVISFPAGVVTFLAPLKDSVIINGWGHVLVREKLFPAGVITFPAYFVEGEIISG